MTTVAHYLAGAGKQEIVFDGIGIGMMGYGRADHVIERQATPLYSRAFCFLGNDGQALLFAQAEICMVLPEIKRAVLAQLQARHGDVFSSERLLLCAQHTHSAPGGYAHFPFYNFSIPAFRPAIFAAIVDSLSRAIEQAYAAREPALLKFGHGDFADSDEVAFNRSLAAHRRNPGVPAYAASESHRAIERTMWLLLAQTPDGRTLGQINWFGVHPTSVGNRNRYVSYDNKGYAAEALETALGPGSVAIFAQQFAGDVSPNAQSADKHWPRGRHPDDTDSARYNGALQCTQALRIIAALRQAAPLAVSDTDAALVQRDFSAIEIDADLVDGCSGLRTSAPCHGLAFFRGSPVDGPGAPAPVAALLGLLARWTRWRDQRRARRVGGDEQARIHALHAAQAPKLIVSETAAGRVAGLTRLRRIPRFVDAMVAELAREESAGALEEKPWVPVVLPLQYWRLGPLALIGFPGEITTMAGRQLRELCRELLRPLGIDEVIISSYANSYFGYCTTWFEYQEQQYEGGHTTFGSQTFNAFRTEYRKLLRQCARPPGERALHSDAEKIFSPSTVAARSHG